MTPVDIHILHLPPDNPDWLQQAIVSAEAIPGAAVHVVEGVAGHLGLSRASAYRQGAADFVSFVDSDDVLYPEFAAIPAALERHPDAAAAYGHVVALDDKLFTLQHTLQRWSRQRQARLPRSVRAPIVYRRAAIMPHLAELTNWPRYADRVLTGLATQHGRFVFVPKLGYIWRQHAGNMHRDEDLAERRRASLLLQKVLQ